METQAGRITLVQEGRFQLVGDDGRTCLFILHHNAPLEPQDLPALQRAQARVAVTAEAAHGKIACIAHAVRILQPEAPEVSP